MRLFPGCCACAMYSAKPLAISTAIAKIRVLFMRTPIDARSRRTFRAPKFSALILQSLPTGFELDQGPTFYPHSHAKGVRARPLWSLVDIAAASKTDMCSAQAHVR
jgi:hypothetical protein